MLFGRISRDSIMLWLVCLWVFIVHDRSSSVYGLQIHLNMDGQAVAVAGVDASLTCYYSPELSSASQFDALVWKFAPKSDPETEVEMAYYRVSTGVQYNNRLSSKLVLNASWQYGGALKIMNTSLDDQGEYTCQLATSLGFKDSVITLKVYAVPRFLQITNSSHQHQVDPSAPYEMTSGEPHTIVCSSFPPSSPATNLSWVLDPILKIARNMIHVPSTIVTSSRSASSSSSLSGDWEFFSTERRLVLTPRDEDHGAVIRCYGDHAGLLPARLSVSITLSVLVSPSYIRIFDDNFRLLSDAGILNVTQDSAVTFVCISTRSRPPTTPIWRIGDDVIEGNLTIIPYDDDELNDVSTRLTLPRVLQEHHGKEVTCSASGLNLRDVATNITLNVLGPPDPPRITNSAGAFIEGRSRSLECVALNGYPPGVIEWLLDGDPTSDTSNTVVKRWRYDVTSRVTINPDRSMNGKEVKCTVRSPSVSTTEMQSAIVLDVQYCPHRVSISCEPIVAGRPSTMICESSVSNPAPHHLWIVDGREIDVDHDVTFSNSTNTTEGFMASSVFSGSFDAEDHGKIIRCCAARNEAIGCTTDVCTECHLNVYCKPKLIQEGNDMITSVHDYYITLRCSARGNPPPSIEWYSPWMVQHHMQINASTYGVISLVDTIIDGEGSDRVTIQSTLVIELSAGTDTRVRGSKCMASNSIGSSSTTSFFGNTDDISSEYDPATGLLTVKYSAGSVVPLPADATPCVHVDYKPSTKRVWKLGATCFKLLNNETVVQVQAGMDRAEIGLRVCYYEEFCSIPTIPNSSSQTSPIAQNNILFPILVVAIAICVILGIAGALFIYQKRGRKVHERSRHTPGEPIRNQVSFRRRTDQRPHAEIEDHVHTRPTSTHMPRSELNDYMDMTSSGTAQGATSGGVPSQPDMMTPFQDSGDLLAYEDMRVDDQGSSAGYALYTAGCQPVDSMVYANMATSTNPLKRSDSGICCTYSISPLQTDSAHLQNTYESSIFATPSNLQMPKRSDDHGDDHGDAFMTSTSIPSPSSSTVASEWSFFPTHATGSTSRNSRSASRDKHAKRGGMPLYAIVPYEVE